MLTGALLAVAAAAGVPWPMVGAIALAVVHPAWFLAAVAGWVMWHRRTGRSPGPDDEAAFLRGLAAELSAGASLRGAVVAAARRSPALDLGRAARLCAAGRPAGEIGSELASALPVNGTAAAAAFRLATRTGGSTAAVMEALAERAEASGRLARERSALTAQARLSAWVVGGLPVGLVVLGVVTGAGPGGGDLGPGGTAMVAAGLALIGAGAALVWLMAARSAR
ncbi:MAG: type II secretion system F family protein [Actinobacteria bacterium]|nr:type II secretion system F family protein [Actinomycetota bacterium]